jgi:ubiquinone/menaquinone biosynthesis C-methylase UbiE
MENPDVDRFDRWARRYDQHIGQRFFFVPVHALMLGIIAEALGETAPVTIVDVGCGTGRLLGAVAARWPGAALVGCDPARRMIEQARLRTARAAFSVAPAESLPLPDRSADLVLSSISFHHWADQAQGIREIARALKPGGFFCLADHVFTPARLGGERVRSRGEVRRMMTAEGLDVHRQRAVLPFVVVTLARKP